MLHLYDVVAAARMIHDDSLIITRPHVQARTIYRHVIPCALQEYIYNQYSNHIQCILIYVSSVTPHLFCTVTKSTKCLNDWVALLSVHFLSSRYQYHVLRQ